MNVDNKLDLAIFWAICSHGGQKDKAGQPYILHPLAVMFKVQALFLYPNVKEPPPGITVEDLMIAAVLHDAIEDSDLTLQEIEATFGKVVRDILDGVTRRKGENYLKEFIPRAKAHPGARIVKTADLLHNMSRLHLLSKKDWQRLEKRYLPAEAILNDS